MELVVIKNPFRSKLSIDIKINNTKINKLKKAQREAAKMTAEALKTEINTMQVVPKQTGVLEESVSINLKLLNKGQLKITYDTPYARRLYYHPEYNFRKDKNKNAQGRWLEVFTEGNKKDFSEKAYYKCYKKLTGV
ncbi:minor capsid protein [Clostridioides difficile]